MRSMTKGKQWPQAIQAASAPTPRERSKAAANPAPGAESLRKVRRAAPDLALMEISIPRMTGVAVTELSPKGKPTIKILALSVPSTNGGGPCFSEDIPRAGVNHFSGNRGKAEPFAGRSPPECTDLK